MQNNNTFIQKSCVLLTFSFKMSLQIHFVLPIGIPGEGEYYHQLFRLTSRDILNVNNLSRSHTSHLYNLLIETTIKKKNSDCKILLCVRYRGSYSTSKCGL